MTRRERRSAPSTAWTDEAIGNSNGKPARKTSQFDDRSIPEPRTVWNGALRVPGAFRPRWVRTRCWPRSRAKSRG